LNAHSGALINLLFDFAQYLALINSCILFNINLSLDNKSFWHPSEFLSDKWQLLLNK